MTFSEKLKKLRLDKNITQEQASKEMGIAISSLRNYENGRLPDTHQLKIIKNYYQVPYEYLLEDSCENSSNKTVNISQELQLSDKSIEKIKYINSYENTKELNFHIENLSTYSIECIRYLKNCYFIRIEYIGFLSCLYGFETYINENINNKDCVYELLSIFRKKLKDLELLPELEELKEIERFYY